MNENFFELNLAGWQLRVRAGDADYKHRYIWDGGRHSHGEYELHVVLSGKAQLEVGKEQHLLTAGMAMVIAPGLFHMAKTEPGKIERFSMQTIVPKGVLSESLQREAPCQHDRHARCGAERSKKRLPGDSKSICGAGAGETPGVCG